MRKQIEALKNQLSKMYQELKGKAETYGDLEKLIEKRVKENQLDTSLMIFADKCLRKMLHSDWSRAVIKNQDKLGAVYLCDGREECSGQENCYMIGGFCRHTHDIAHAKNFYRLGREGDYREIDPDRARNVSESSAEGKVIEDEQETKRDTFVSGEVEIKIQGVRGAMILDPEQEKARLERLLETVQKFREKFPAAKINIDYTER
ncbi:MAG: hypothetical protein NC517_09975 [Firmicutes bacterium]|nr:hypothetical protein [Bacillota bacterium]